MSREALSYLRLLHGAYNTCMLALFVYQGILGRRIRRSGDRPLDTIRRHRKTGPVAAALGMSGFVAGMIVVYLDAGHIFKYPLHFINGLMIVLLILATYLLSKKIRGSAPVWRNRHYTAGILIIVLYCIQAVLGLGILL